jgi:hypothetical protein
MQRFLVYAFTLSALCTLLVGVARWVGARQPQHALVEGLRLTDCALPCWIGITPGQTMMEEAYQRLAEVFLYADTGSSASVGRFQNLHFVVPVMNSPVSALPVTIQAVEGRVVLIQLVITDRRRLTFADIILTYGAPTCVMYTESPVFIGWRLYYETPAGVAQIDAYGSAGDSIHQAQPIYSIVLRGSDTGSACFFRNGESLPRWRGFGPRSRYIPGQV